MNKKLVGEVRDLVKKACLSDQNFFEPSVWENHILPVISNARILATRLGADEEICVLAALLHDYASISNKDWVEDHHIKGMELAQEVLQKYHYPQERIDRIKACIYSHRGSQKISRRSVEEEILASADSMSHFQKVGALFYLAFHIRGMSQSEGTAWVLAKLERSYQKLMPQAREMTEDQRAKIKAIFA